MTVATKALPGDLLNRGVVINPKLLLFSMLRSAYFVLRKGALTQYEVRTTQHAKKQEFRIYDHPSVK